MALHVLTVKSLCSVIHSIFTLVAVALKNFCACVNFALSKHGFFYQPDQSAIRRMLHASGVNKKTIKKKQKVEKAMAAFKVSLSVTNFYNMYYITINKYLSKML